MRYQPRTTGDTERDTFPYSVIDTETGRIVNSFTHAQIAEDVALRMSRPETQPRSIYDYDEAQEQM